MNMEKIALLFAGWDKGLILSGLQGCMGFVIADDEDNPTSAMMNVGDFCFFAGEPNPVFFEKITCAQLLIPKDERWETLIESHYGDQVEKGLRYAIKKEPDVFDVNKLEAYGNALQNEYEMKLFDEKIFEMSRGDAWSANLCSQFEDYEDYRKRAIGVAILYQGRLVAGASPYAVYRDGIEIEIDTKPEFRKKGLATACGAKLILECLERNLYPCWDAHDLRSVALAEKLGYHFDKEYTTYELV